MLNRRALKNAVQRFTQCVKRTSGARDLTISFRGLVGPGLLKLLAVKIVYFSISFRNTTGPIVS